MLHHFENFPALEAAQWAGLADANGVTNLGGTVFIMGVKFLGNLDDFFEFRVSP
jgi:hypothetical protein